MERKVKRKEKITTEGSGYQAWELTNQLMTLEVIHRSS
jgi:hypothetical protein